MDLFAAAAEENPRVRFRTVGKVFDFGDMEQVIAGRMDVHNPRDDFGQAALDEGVPAGSRKPITTSRSSWPAKCGASLRCCSDRMLMPQRPPTLTWSTKLDAVRTEIITAPFRDSSSASDAWKRWLAASGSCTRASVFSSIARLALMY